MSVAWGNWSDSRTLLLFGVDSLIEVISSALVVAHLAWPKQEALSQVRSALLSVSKSHQPLSPCRRCAEAGPGAGTGAPHRVHDIRAACRPGRGLHRCRRRLTRAARGAGGWCAPLLTEAFFNAIVTRLFCVVRCLCCRAALSDRGRGQHGHHAGVLAGQAVAGRPAGPHIGRCG